MDKNNYDHVYTRLKYAMRSAGVTQLSICDSWSESHPDKQLYQSRLSLMLSCKADLPLSIAYHILHEIGIPSEKIYEFFPPNGGK